ncbi:hypothetical protein H8B09_24645 [Paenibacillus sp. PR3]|uniref:Uncharacterized protein n=1 Tax=Paenibacillus terricola TaxID=2763503 RepID=A0ABR8N561_9BACL|nr:hypothetical protein [Paenibacillus terricola]MBD3921974.1 hypothetical protein [Paenibacillus terricola]
MRAIIQTIGILFIVGLIVSAWPAEPVHASFISRVQDIYNAPDKISEIEQQYKEANEQLSQQLEESRKAAEALARQQEELQKQNQQLMEQNAALQAEAEQVQKKKEAFQRKMYTGIGIVAGLFIAYFLAIRIWRYLSWRRHRPFREGGISG